MTQDEKVRVLASIRTDLNKEIAALTYLGRESMPERPIMAAVRHLQDAVDELNQAVPQAGGRA